MFSTPGVPCPRVIRHLAEYKPEGTLIVPEWGSSPFWSMLFGPQSLYSTYVKCTSIFSDVSGVFAIGSTDSLFDGPKFKSRVLAVRLSLVMIFNLMILYIIITWSYSVLNVLAIMFPVSGLFL